MVDGKEQGPFSRKELRNLPYITPYTLVKKVGQKEWRPLYKVPELEDLFIEKEQQSRSHSVDPRGFATLTMQIDPGHFIWCLLFAALILTYVYYRLLHG
jgi:hypothetical protein